MTDSLSPREQLILELAAKGHTDKGIASEIGIAPSTVLTYWLRIRSKLGPHPRAELVAAYVRALAENDVAKLKADLDVFIERSERLNRELGVMRQFIESAPEAMLVVGADGVIRFGNVLAAELFGCTEEDLAGSHSERFIPEELRDAHRLHHARYLQDPHRMQMGHARGIPYLTCSGERKFAIATLNLAPTLDGDSIILILRGIDHGGHGDVDDSGEPISGRL